MSRRLPEPGRRIRSITRAAVRGFIEDVTGECVVDFVWRTGYDRVVRLADGRSLHPDLGDRWTDVEGDRADLD